MKLLWHTEWKDAPCYAPAAGGLLVAVDAAVPIVIIRHAAARVLRSPVRKVFRFLLSDGPSSTYRKARTKLREHGFSGDYRVSLVLGRVVGCDRNVVALACRVPPCADYLPVHPRLAIEVDDTFTSTSLAGAAAFVASETALVEQLGRQRYLYSGDEPPIELIDLLALSLDAPPRPEGASLLRPPSGHRDFEPVLRLSPVNPVGLPVAVLGAGDYVRTEIVPTLSPAFARVVVSDREPQVAARFARETGFALATTDAAGALDELVDPGVVFVATAHDTHALLGAKALARGHQVFLEKPPVVTEDDLELLIEAILAVGKMPEIGFNRRYNRLIGSARTLLAREQGPATITCVVREVSVEPDHWYLWPNQGTRVTGNLCHWIDLGIFLLGGGRTPLTVTVSPSVGRDAHEVDEDRAVTVTFDDGSVMSLLPTGRGDDLRGVQELIDIRCGRLSILIDDLWHLTARKNGRTRHMRTLFRDKGHSRMYREATGRFERGLPSSYQLDDLVVVSAIQIAAADLVRTNEPRVSISESVLAWRERSDLFTAGARS